MRPNPKARRPLYIVRWMIAGAAFGALFPAVAWLIAVAHEGSLTFGELHTLYPMMWIVDLAPTVLGLAGGGIGVLYARLADAKAKTESTARQIAASWTSELHRANHELVDTLKSRSTFYAAVTHELRSPLTAIVGYADVAEELASEPPEVPEYLAAIYAEATAMLQMVNDLLDAAKLGASGIAIEMQEVSCEDAIEDVVARLTPLADQKGLSLSSSVPIDAACWADPVRLRQVLTNVVANAIKYSETGGIEVLATTSDTMCSVEVTDQGVGVAEEELESIFEAFDSGSSGAGRRDSSGLGLAISRCLVEAMDGDLTVDSAGPGQGSTFRLNLQAVGGQRPESRRASLATVSD